MPKISHVVVTFLAHRGCSRVPVLGYNSGRNRLKGTPMIRELIHDDAILSTPCEPATAEDAPVIQDVLDTLVSLSDAGCLAANQIGVTKAICAVEGDDGKPFVMLNPKLVFGLGPQRVQESCLTREGVVNVKRHIKIKVDFDELVDGELRHRRREYAGFTAQMIQHMIDHCNGKLV